MAVEQPGFSIGFMKAAADLTAKQYYCVEVTADETVNVNNAAGEKILGVLQNKPNIGQAATIMCTGVTKIVAGAGDLAAGATWEAAADGTGIAATAAKAGCGTVLIGATAGNLATVTIGFATGAALAA